MANSFIGSSVDEWMDAAGDRDEIEALALKEIIVDYLHAALDERGISQSELARRMNTSPSAVHRLLDEYDTSMTLATLARACAALDVSLGVVRLQRPQRSVGAQSAAPVARKAPAARRRTKRAAIA